MTFLVYCIVSLFHFVRLVPRGFTFLWHDIYPVCARLGLAIVPLCRDTGAPFDEHRRPLAPSKFFDVCVIVRRKILLSLWPLTYVPGHDDY